MTCPECSNRMSVIKTAVLPSRTIRVTECACGVRAETEERIIRRLPMLPVTVRQPPGNGPNEAGNHSATGKPILLPDLIRPDSGQVSDLRLDHSQRVDPAKAEYELDFIVFWNAIEPNGRRKGDKAEAQKVWRKKGRPNSANLIAGWKRYRISCGDGYTMDADRWLRSDGWAKEYEPAPKEIVRGMRPDPPRPDLNCRDWHAGGKNTGKRNPRGEQSGCPECKSAYLRAWTRDDRPGEPTSAREVMSGGKS